MTATAEKIAQLPSLRLTVEAHGLMAKKALGQNFLLDQNITDKIVSSSLERQGLKDFHGAYVFEIGPGPGGLTRAIAAAEPKKLTVDGRALSGDYGRNSRQNRRYDGSYIR